MPNEGFFKADIVKHVNKYPNRNYLRIIFTSKEFVFFTLQERII